METHGPVMETHDPLMEPISTYGNNFFAPVGFRKCLVGVGVIDHSDITMHTPCITQIKLYIKHAKVIYNGNMLM